VPDNVLLRPLLHRIWHGPVLQVRGKRRALLLPGLPGLGRAFRGRAAVSGGVLGPIRPQGLLAGGRGAVRCRRRRGLGSGRHDGGRRSTMRSKRTIRSVRSGWPLGRQRMSRMPGRVAVAVCW